MITFVTGGSSLNEPGQLRHLLMIVCSTKGKLKCYYFNNNKDAEIY
jgi:hypothetical protein